MSALNEEDIDKLVEERYSDLKNSGRKLMASKATNNPAPQPVILDNIASSEEIREEIMAEQETKKRIRESTDSIIVNVRKLLKIAGSSKKTLEEQLDAIEKLKKLEKTIGIGVDPEPAPEQLKSQYAGVTSKFKEIDYHPPAEKKKIATGYNADEFVVQAAAQKKKPTQYDGAKSRVFDIQPVPKEKTKRAELEERKKMEQSKNMEFVCNGFQIFFHLFFAFFFGEWLTHEKKDESLLNKLRESSKQAQKHLEKKNEEKKKKLDTLLEKLEVEEKKKQKQMRNKRKTEQKRREHHGNKGSTAKTDQQEPEEDQQEQEQDSEPQQEQEQEQAEDIENEEQQQEEGIGSAEQ